MVKSVARLVLIVILDISLMVYMESADLTELCSTKQPIDAGLSYLGWTHFIKGSNVWRLNQTNIDKMEGPFKLKEVFPGIDVDSIDAAFHIKIADNQVDDNTYAMAYLAFLFKHPNYYIYKVIRHFNSEYQFYENKTGVPFSLDPGKGHISLFNIGSNRPLDSVFFDSTNFEAMFLVDKDIYAIGSFEMWTDSQNYVNPSKLKDLMNIDERVDAAIDLNFGVYQNEVMLIFGQNYCLFKWSDGKCDKKSIQSYFNCKQKTESPQTDTTPKESMDSSTSIVSETVFTTMATTVPLTQYDPDAPLVTDTKTTMLPSSETEAESDDDSDKTAIILIVVIAVVCLLVLICFVIVLFFSYFDNRNQSKGSSSLASKPSVQTILSSK